MSFFCLYFLFKNFQDFPVEFCGSFLKRVRVFRAQRKPWRVQGSQKRLKVKKVKMKKEQNQKTWIEHHYENLKRLHLKARKGRYA